MRDRCAAPEDRSCNYHSSYLATRTSRCQAEDGILTQCVTGVQTCALLFSSRRRHTRSLCDWSSDVCSSDLHVLATSMDEMAIYDKSMPALWSELLKNHQAFERYANTARERELMADRESVV